MNKLQQIFLMLSSMVIGINLPVSAQSSTLPSSGLLWPNAWTDLHRTAPYTIPPILTEGRNADLGNSFETLWPPGDIRPQPVSALLMTVASTDADDTVLGTGARTVDIFCLDANYDAFVENLDLNGLTAVSMASACLRIQRVRLASTGLSGTNEGSLSIENTGTVYEFVPVGLSSSKSAVFTIPNGKRGAIKSLLITANVKDIVEIDLITRLVNGTIFGNIFNLTDSLNINEFPFCFSGKSDFEIRANAEGGGGSKEVEVTFSMLVIDGGGDCP